MIIWVVRAIIHPAKTDFWYNILVRAKDRRSIGLERIEVQQAVVALFNAANEAKKIAAEADKLSREICPAFIQRIVKEVA